MSQQSAVESSTRVKRPVPIDSSDPVDTDCNASHPVLLTPGAERPTKAAKVAKTTVTRVMNVSILRDGKIYEDDIWFRDGKIIDPVERFWVANASSQFAANQIIDGHGLIVVPGFIDVQLNGAFGVDFTSSTNIQADLRKVAGGILKYGVTSFCPTLVTSSAETYHRVIPLCKRFKGTAQQAENLGLHLEGPFISDRKYGAHRLEYVREPVEGEKSIRDMYGPSLFENVAMVTIAPELKGADDAILFMTTEDLVVSAGHSAACMDEAETAVEHGCSMITHLFNAMKSFHHRDPGLVGLLGSSHHRPYYGLIVDGIHAHPASVKIAYSSHPDGCILVSDAMAAMGLPEGKYKLGSMDVLIHNKEAKIEGTDTLAGAIAPLDECIRNYRKFTSCSIVEAIEAATLHPARMLNLTTKGSLDYGCDADLVFLDPKTLEVKYVYVGGELAWSAKTSEHHRDDHVESASIPGSPCSTGFPDPVRVTASRTRSSSLSGHEKVWQSTRSHRS